MKKLSLKQILDLHEALINRFGGSSGVRDQAMLDLSVNSAFQTYAGQYLYENVISQSVHLGYSLIMNHPFVDGNKRIDTHAMLTNLYINGYSLSYDQEELIDIIIKIASSEYSEKDLLAWVNNHLNKAS